MPRKKLTEEEKKARKEKLDAERIASNLQGHLRDLKRHSKLWIYKDPTYTFEVGQRVHYGGHDKVEIKEVHDGGKIYKVRTFGMTEVYGRPTAYDKEQYVGWSSLRPLRTMKEREKNPRFGKPNDMHIQFCQQDISSILSLNRSGINIEPDYQRGNVWEMEDKIKLLDSIFNNIDIGKFAIIERDAGEHYYELLDGKQRLLALIEFYENRYQYNGVYFNDLHWKDQWHFTTYSISTGYVTGKITQKQKYEYFLKLNTGGKPVDPSHLEKVRELFDNA